VLSVLILGGVVAALAPGVAATASSKPPSGGSLTAYNGNWSTLDPGNPAWAVGSSTFGYAIYGTLFEPAGRNVKPDLATGYTYSHDGKTLTLTLRPHVKFQDGSPFNAAAVKFNILRYQMTQGLTTTAFFSEVSSVTTVGADTVIIHLSQPDYNLINVMSDTAAGFMVSPTSLASLGASQFSITPVGAGPFKVSSDNVNVSATLVAWGGYWDQKHRYLSQLNFIENSNDQTALTSLESGSVQLATFTDTSTPSVVATALSDPSLHHIIGADLATSFIVLNTFKAPFNNILAREALDYCLDRTPIAENVMGGIGHVRYVNAGSASDYYPGNKPPPNFYNYDVAKGTAIVNQLGGLSFSVIPLAPSTQFLNIIEGLDQEWAQCGIKATVNVVPGTVRVQDTSTGNYQAFVTLSGGVYNPYYATALYSVPGEADDLFGFNSPTVTNLINATGYTQNKVALAGIWKRIYDTEDQLAVNIPIASGPNINVFASNLHGLVPVEAFYDLAHAYFK